MVLLTVAREGYLMATIHTTQHRASEAAIFARLWETENGHLAPELAHHIIKICFSAEDKARMRELAVKNQEEGLSPEEKQELDNFIKVGDLLAILQSKARQVLKQGRTSLDGNG